MSPGAIVITAFLLILTAITAGKLGATHARYKRAKTDLAGAKTAVKTLTELVKALFRLRTWRFLALAAVLAIAVYSGLIARSGGAAADE